MKIYLPILIILLFESCDAWTPKEENKIAISGKTNTKTISGDVNTTYIAGKTMSKNVYKIILKTSSVPGDINTTITKKLPEPIKALAAFYAAMGGTMCNGESCELTTALGLGKQGSDKHKNLIKKYFPNDKVAKVVLKQNCYLRPSGASTFSDYEYLTITDYGDTVKVDYNLMYYDCGEEDWTNGPDTYLFKENIFIKITRNIWKFADKEN